MNVGSLFSGVGGFDLGLERAGMRVVFQCEADPYRRRVLQRHWPCVPCYEDVRMVGVRQLCGARRGLPTAAQGAVRPPAAIDLLVGGFPCQDLSVAGRRRGLAGERSALFFELARVADELVPGGGWLLAENVPGLLSSHGGRDFAVVLATLADIGFHDLAWRVLDSRFFGVPQRRRRVFILARRACGRSACEVLLEPEGRGGNSAARTEAGSRVAGVLGAGSSSTRSEVLETDYAHQLTSGGGKPDQGFAAARVGSLVRRLTPTECERLQGFPDGWTCPDGSSLIGEPFYPDRVDESCPRPDGPRYAAMGDAVTVNVIEWIGRRLMGRVLEPHVTPRLLGSGEGQ